MNAYGVQPADVVIEPDVSGYDLAQFTKARELAAIGADATRSQIPKIKQLLSRLDPQLFCQTADAANVTNGPITLKSNT